MEDDSGMDLSEVLDGLDPGNSVEGLVDMLNEIRPTEPRKVSEEDIKQSIVEIGEGIYRSDGWLPEKEAKCCTPGCGSPVEEGTGHCKDHNKNEYELALLTSGCKVPGRDIESPKELKNMSSKKEVGFSKKFFALKEVVSKRQGGLCASCGHHLTNDSKLHHKIYMYDADFHPAWGMERPEHMEVVCAECHIEAHDLEGTSVGDGELLTASILDTIHTLEETLNVK